MHLPQYPNRYPPRRAASNLLLFLTAFLISVLLGIPAPAKVPKNPQNAGSETTRVEIAAADSMQRKIDYLKRNATITPPDPRPTIFLQTEINSYFAQHRVKLPEGIMSVNFNLAPETVTAKTRVDFDQLTANRGSYNPLLAIFSGVHDVQVIAIASGKDGSANVYVRSVTLDGVSVPRMALDMFVHRFVNPKYPSISLDGEYKLPVRIDTVTIGDRRGTVTQK
jgi:hypothetical protein